MVRDGRLLRRTVLIGVGALGMGSLLGSVRVGAQEKPRGGATERSVPSDEVGPERAVLYEEDPGDAKGRKFFGSVAWSAGRERVGANAKSEMVLRARVIMPDHRLGLKLAIRLNTDKSLPASHTVELIFDPPRDHGDIENVPGMLVKNGESERGLPLAGLAVKVTTGFFMIGLSAVEAESRRNITLLKERSWLDIPIVYNDKRRAILAIEKGRSGERAFSEALAAWGSAMPEQKSTTPDDKSATSDQQEHRLKRPYPFPPEIIESPRPVPKP